MKTKSLPEFFDNKTYKYMLSMSVFDSLTFLKFGKKRYSIERFDDEYCISIHPYYFYFNNINKILKITIRIDLDKNRCITFEDFKDFCKIHKYKYNILFSYGGGEVIGISYKNRIFWFEGEKMRLTIVELFRASEFSKLKRSANV